MLKKIISILLVLCFIFGFSACNNANTIDNDSSLDLNNNESELETNGINLSFSRLKSVTTTYDGETKVCNVVWDGSNCEFDTYFDYPKNPIYKVKGVWDAEQRIFSMEYKLPDDNKERIEVLPIHQYDENQKIINVYNEDDISEVWNVTYNDDNIPTWTGGNGRNNGEPFSFDKEKRIVTVLTSSGSSKNPDGTHSERKTYKELTLDADGNIVKVDRVKYSHNGDGNFQKTEVIEGYEVYTYDSKGNIIKFENNDGSMIVEFEYYDESIQHIWERMLPISYIEMFDIYAVPFYWYL